MKYIFLPVKHQVIEMTLCLIFTCVKLTLEQIFSRVKNGSFQKPKHQNMRSRVKQKPCKIWDCGKELMRIWTYTYFLCIILPLHCQLTNSYSSNRTPIHTLAIHKNPRCTNPGSMMQFHFKWSSKKNKQHAICDTTEQEEP